MYDHPVLLTAILHFMTTRSGTWFQPVHTCTLAIPSFLKKSSNDLYVMVPRLSSMKIMRSQNFPNHEILGVQHF